MKKKINSHIFNGKRYKIEFKNRKVIVTMGDCDPPNEKNRKIRLWTKGITKRKFLVNCIHEALHAEDWEMSESKVQRISSDIGRFLWRLGYKKSDDENS